MHVTPQNAQVGQVVADELARRLGVQLHPQASLAFAVQAQRETGGPIVANNPLNLTDPGHSFLWREFGQVGHRSGGTVEEWHTNFAAFDTVEGGARAAAANYLGGLYGGVVDALRRGAGPVELAEAIQSSPWSTDRYGGTLDDQVLEELGAVASVPAAPIAQADAARAVSDVGRDIAAAAATLPVKAAQRVGGDVAGAAVDHFAPQLVVALLVLLAVILIVGVLS